MKLSKRLETVVSFVETGSRVADVGTDHGYVPIALAERGIAVHGVAMHIPALAGPGFLSLLEMQAQGYYLRIRLFEKS